MMLRLVWFINPPPASPHWHFFGQAGKTRATFYNAIPSLNYGERHGWNGTRSRLTASIKSSSSAMQWQWAAGITKDSSQRFHASRTGDGIICGIGLVWRWRNYRVSPRHCWRVVRILEGTTKSDLSNNLSAAHISLWRLRESRQKEAGITQPFREKFAICTSYILDRTRARLFLRRVRKIALRRSSQLVEIQSKGDRERERSKQFNFGHFGTWRAH